MENFAIKKILLVDDNCLALEMTGKAFENNGFKVFKALSVHDALTILEVSIPDIILSDYEMPVTNGFDFRHQLIENPKLKNIPFVFLTAHADQKLMMKGLDLQAVDYIIKGTPIKVVVSKLNNILSAVREQHERSMQELRIAAEGLDLRSVPAILPNIPGFKIDFWHQTFQNYPGGDFMDFIPVDQDFTFVILGDVMGKKWGAWFFSFSFLSYIRSAIRFCVYENNFSIADILQKINRVVCLDPLLKDVLSTLSLVMINHATGEVTYAGAGDMPLIFYNKEKDMLEPVKSAGLLLGLFPDGFYTEDKLHLQSGDQLLMISDGMIDFEDEGGIKSDYKLFLSKIKPYLGKADTLNQLKTNLFFKNLSQQQVDDCSLIFIEKN
ncbi:MAG: SpoIIE family protein phosphatase [Sphingobacteriaceae bacterium]